MKWNLAIALVVSLVNAPPAFPQTPQPSDGSIRGYVRDTQGAVVTGATVTATSAAAPTPQSAVSDAEGYYRLAPLAPGSYTLIAELPGFSNYVRENVDVRAGLNLALEIVMQVGSLSDSVTVTAQKRGGERLQDVPVPVSVLDANRLVRSHQLRLQDYAATVPGLNVGLTPSTFQLVSIRGVTTGSASANPKVGILIDDVPYGASTHRGGGLFVPDIDPDDLVRVEVLRGPQGTLYGAGSLGGLISYITNDPSTDKVRGRVDVGATSVSHGADPGYAIRGAVNVPVNQALAISLSGFTRQEPGYVDNIATGESDYNQRQVSGGRLAALWQPSSRLSMKLSALYQDFKGDRPDEVALQPGTLLPAAGDLQIRYLKNAGEYEKTAQLYSGVIKAKIAGMDLTSVTGYGRFDPVSTQDFSTAGPFNSLAPSLYGVTGVKQDDGRHIRKWTEELRLSIPIAAKLEWLIGGFYTRETVGQFQDIWAVDANTGGFAGDMYIFSGPSTFAERALFTDLTYRLTSRFDVQVGVRRSDFDHSVQYTFSGPYVPATFRVPSPLVLPKANQDAGPTTYLLTPRMRLSPDTMLYARVASGYGAGGLTSFPNTGAFQPFGPERTRNYEVGLKSDVLGHRVSLDLSVYHIDYDDLQVSLRDAVSGLTFTANGGKAKSQGAELSLSVRPVRDLSIRGWASYDNAVLTEPLGAGSLVATVAASAGDRLPATGRWSGHVSVEQGFALSSAVKALAGASVSYVDERLGIFTAAGTPRRVYPSYAKTDLYARADFGTWSLNFFMNNATDTRGAIWGDTRGATPVLLQIQPRTFGLSLGRTF